jgi:hypothetical protein
MEGREKNEDRREGERKKFNLLHCWRSEGHQWRRWRRRIGSSGRMNKVHTVLLLLVVIVMMRRER